MEASLEEIARTAVPSSAPLEVPRPATAVAFDDVQELLWIGNDSVSHCYIGQGQSLTLLKGRIVSFYGSGLQRYTSLRAHLDEGPVKQILVHDRGILSISATAVHFARREGLTQWHLTHPQMTDLRCMAFTGNASQILVAGCQTSCFVVDIEKGQVISQLPSQGKYTMMKKSKHICAGTEDGMVHILSLTDFSILSKWKAHSKAINDMDARNDFLVTCGFAVRGQLQHPIVDTFVQVFDLKTLRLLPPMTFPAGAAYVRLHPKLQTTAYVASQTGSIQVVDLMNQAALWVKPVPLQFMLSMDVSSSGDVLSITDSSATVYLLGPRPKSRFNNISKETEFAHSPPQNTTHVDWTETPLNTIGIPYYQDKLLSAWPSHLLFEIGAPPVPTDPNLLPYLQHAEMGQYGPHLNPRKLHRHQVEDTRGGLVAASIAAPKFLSEKAKDATADLLGLKMSDAAEILSGVASNGKAQTDEERMLKYSNVEIKYSRFGVDDFDFRYYNKTPYSGLETHITNSFVNSLLQLYKFVPLIRNVAIQHAASPCVAPNCLLCEFGFLFDMLEKATGQNCQATNLLRAFGASREAAHLNLFEESSIAAGASLSNAIQSVNRFFLKQVAHDHKLMMGTTDGVDEILATGALEAIRCMYCSNETMKPGSSYVHDLVYPPNDPKHNPRAPIFKFSSILKATIEKENKSRGWCNKCRRYQPLSTRKTIQHLPFVLMLNAALINPAMKTFWETPGWLPAEVGVLIQNRAVYCFEGADLQNQLRNRPQQLVVYELVGFVAEIDMSDRQQPHLVSMVNVEISATHQIPVTPGHKGFPDWHLFNDFLVSPIDPREALHFNKSWKLPSIVTYQVKSAHGKVDETWRETMDTTLLYQEYSVNGKYPVAECQILASSEQPSNGTAIALDTEFVELARAELDVKADGTQETIRPAKSGLARVSVLRGDGESEGSPFIDDYITVYEPVVDYKTQYSGIQPGDLDISTSKHNLVPLKVAYKKLWLLLNLGCTFVGHGLASDFRKTNIHVPKAQTVDTQYLYLAPGKNRRFSLRYLAWAVFKEYIQEETYDDSGHDSIEDARMALRLWRKFQEYEDAGIAEQMIEDIYRKGTKYGWKPPPRDGLMPVLGSTGTGANSAVPSGRATPEPYRDGGVGPSTPGAKATTPGASKFNAMGGGFFVPGNGVVRESPLR